MLIVNSNLDFKILRELWKILRTTIATLTLKAGILCVTFSQPFKAIERY